MFTENREKGTSAVEFALILPLLLLMLFAIIEFGFVLYDKAVITNASREGARKGILMRDPRVSEATIKSTVSAYCARNLISFGTTTTPSTTVLGAPCPASEDDITVTVAYPYKFLVLPNLLSSVAGQINLTAATVMRCE
jgi:Flp pilus assembly protein TadG